MSIEINENQQQHQHKLATNNKAAKLPFDFLSIWFLQCCLMLFTVQRRVRLYQRAHNGNGNGNGVVWWLVAFNIMNERMNGNKTISSHNNNN